MYVAVYLQVISGTVRKLPSALTSKCMFCWSSCLYSAGSSSVWYPCPMRSAFRTSTACEGNAHYEKGWQMYSDTRVFFDVWHFKKICWAVVVFFFCNILQYLQYDLVLGREMHFTDRISSQNHSKSDCYTIFHLYNRKQMAKHHVSLRSKFCVVGVFCWIHHCKCWAKEESYTSFTTLAWPTSPACTVLCTSLLTASCQKQNSVNSQLEHCLFFCRLGKKQHVVSKYSTAASVVCIALCLFY